MLLDALLPRNRGDPTAANEVISGDQPSTNRFAGVVLKEMSQSATSTSIVLAT
jgi:hypothetical protein